MKTLLAAMLLAPAILFAEDLPPRIVDPMPLPAETTTQVEVRPAPAPISVSEKDPADKTWLLYDNRVVKVHLRVRADWGMMELREAEDVGTVIFTISRLPRITFSVVKAPLQDRFESYVSASALTPLYPTIQKKTSSTLAGRKGVLIRGVSEDGRLDESHFSTDGKSFYRVSFSAPSEEWDKSQEHLQAIKRNFRWLN